MGHPVVVDENRIVNFAWLGLERQGDQIPEAAFGQRVLTRDDAIIRIKSDLGMPFENPRQDPRQNLAHIPRRDRSGKEKPNMCTMSRPRFLQCGRKALRTRLADNE